MRVQYTRCCYCFVEIFKDWYTRGQSNHNQGRNSQSSQLHLKSHTFHSQLNFITGISCFITKNKRTVNIIYFNLTVRCSSCNYQLAIK